MIDAFAAIQMAEKDGAGAAIVAGADRLQSFERAALDLDSMALATEGGIVRDRDLPVRRGWDEAAVPRAASALRNQPASYLRSAISRWPRTEHRA